MVFMHKCISLVLQMIRWDSLWGVCVHVDKHSLGQSAGVFVCRRTRANLPGSAVCVHVFVMTDDPANLSGETLMCVRVSVCVCFDR